MIEVLLLALLGVVTVGYFQQKIKPEPKEQIKIHKSLTEDKARRDKK